MPAHRNRVTKGDDYRHIVRRGNRVGGAYCITHAVFPVSVSSKDVREEQVAPARFGFIISKAVGNAVTRNLVRRRMKSVVDRRIAAGYSGVDIVFRALPASATATFADLEGEMNTALDRVERKRPVRAHDSLVAS